MLKSIQLDNLNNQNPITPGIKKIITTKGETVSETEGQKSNGMAETILNLSKEGKAKALEHSQYSETTKESGITSAREYFEIDALDHRLTERKDSSGEYLTNNRLEALRLDDNELYNKIMDLWSQAGDALVHRDATVLHYTQDSEAEGEWNKFYVDGQYSYSISGEQYYDIDRKTANKLREENAQCYIFETPDNSEEAKKLHDKLMREGDDLLYEWEEQHSDENGRFQSPASRQFTAIDVLEKTYSDSTHDTTFNFYGKYDDIQPSHSIYVGASLWHYSTKFNVLLTTDMLNTLASGSKGAANDVLKQIDTAVSNMKDVEKAYSGNHASLRFGVIFGDDGAATYHAIYAGCKEKYGISADDPNSLLEMLMNPETE